MLPDMFSIPLKVYGLGFLISMSIALTIKLLLDGIRFFSKDKTKDE